MRFLAKYDPAQHQGWFAEMMRSNHNQLVIAERRDLDHEPRPGHTVLTGCLRCNADLQHRPEDAPIGTPAICIACAYQMAQYDC